jgi:hypothetical protein
MLALGLGSGEVILWPYLTSNYGLGLVWGAILGITLQYFIDMEIERYALIKGESVFVGLSKLFRWSGWWFIISTFIGFGLPGIIAAAATVLSHLIGVEDFRWVAIMFLIGIGLVLSFGKTVYGLMEKITKTVIFLGIPFIFILALFLTKNGDWTALAQGIIGIGPDYWIWPVGASVATFFGAFAYSGAAGNLNLTQSIYIKEKGYGMGAYSQKISGLFTNLQAEQKIKLEGEEFKLTEENISNFRKWWKQVNREHLFVFWFMGIIAMTLLMVLAYTTTFGLPTNAQGIQFVINEGRIIGERLFPAVGITFLAVVTVMLFQTQLGVLDSTSRIMAENYALKKLGKNQKINVSKIYYTFLWAQIVFGIILFLFNISEPKTLLVLGAVINAFAMFVHIALVNWMNYKVLPKVLQPHWFRKMMIAIAFIVFGVFSVITVWDRIIKIILLSMVQGIYIAALIATLLAGLIIGGIILGNSSKKEYSFYILLFLLTLPMSYLSIWYVRIPFDAWFHSIMTHEGWYTFLTVFYAPLTEEPAKLWPLLIPFFYRRVTKENVVKTALALGLGFGVGEIWYLAWRLTFRLDIVALPWYQLGGFINERLLVCAIHGAFTAVTIYIWKRYGTRAGIIGSVLLHFFGNFPIYLAGINLFGWGKTAWQYILSIYIIIYAFLMAVILLYFQFENKEVIRQILKGEHICPECGKKYRGRWLSLNWPTKTYEKCPYCKKWHWVPYVKK